MIISSLMKSSNFGWFIIIILYYIIDKYYYHPLLDVSYHHFLDESYTIQLSSIIGCFFVSIFGWKLYNKFSIHFWMLYVISFWMNFHSVIITNVKYCASWNNDIIILYTTKNFFRRSIFLYSPCPNLEGIKDALSYKFRRLMIGQNCCAVCTNKVARA